MNNEGNNKNFRQNVVDFFEKNGFFVALGICIVIVAVAVVSIRNNQADGDLSMEASETTYEGEEASGNVIDEHFVLNEDPDGEDAEEVDSNDENQAHPVNAGAEASSVVSAIDFVMPVSGSVTFDYSMDQLTYSRTLEEWRAHSGLDIGAAIGTAVAVVADGTVTDIKNDPGFGYTVIVDHGDGLKTVYANLAREDMVQVNQLVEAGDIIGAVGDTALFECAEESHLHFEVWADGTIADPKNYLPME
ncbi:MAG TPA: hypothetical protein DDZ89_04725 [Clostridiales bacterium]|nr:hypothetical protein [Clostridiales bacterium]